jgi:alkanesulfonate monooxygenase SsuD/methylene tetrahydromethanopterin reductase-like flavin-dependent oxidoreductase (luciferase family)
MKFGIQLHGDRGADAVLREARLADEQGFDSVWLFDHLLGFRGTHVPHEPLDSFTLMTAVGAVTSRVRLAWAMLNPSFRNPAVLAKMLATLDVITHGRVICSLGAGWFEEEYRAYDLQFFDDHTDRIRHEREVALLLKELWTHPAPERVTFDGEYVHVRELAFNPQPIQQPYPPIWIGGDSEDTLAVVKEVADGWVMLRSGNPETLSEVLSNADWPTRPMTVARTVSVYIGSTHAAALAEVQQAVAAGQSGQARTLEDVLKVAVIGTPEECLQRFEEMATWGINYLRLGFWSEAQQELFARTALPQLLEHDALVTT